MTESIRRALISRGQGSARDARKPLKNPLEITRANGLAGQKARRRVRLSAISALALTCGLFANAPSSYAAEYAFTTYPLGSYAFDAGVTPPPGIYVTDSLSYLAVSIGGNIQLGGLVFDAGAKAQFFVEEVSILTVPETKVLDGYLGVLVSVPVAHMNLEATTTGPLGNTISNSTEGWGLGDMALQVQLGWDREDFSHSFHILGVIPTGRYAPGFYPITGFNRPSLDIGWAFTWFEKNTKLQFNGAIGFMTSLENNETQIQTGDEFHAEWAVGYKFDNGLILGVAGYDYRQVTGDSGTGDLLGSFMGTVDAVGPALSYSTIIGKTPVTISVRDYEQYNWKNFLHGNVSIASFTAAFPAGQPLESAKGMKD
jgi:hypothetical protein